ncbi:hypothetical protein LCGC14_2699270, partial [marine sediment metagenome]
MTVTRHSLRFKCRVRDCPWPKDEAIHVPWCLGIDVKHWADKPTHQHWPKKGMGGNNPKSKIVAILCVTCHDRIDNGEWGNAVKPFPGRGRVYFAWDIHGNTLIERDIDDPVLSDGDEAALPTKGAPTSVSSPSPSAGEKEESDGEDGKAIQLDGAGPDGHTDNDVRSPGRLHSHTAALTHEQRVAIAQQIKDAKQRHPFFAGDTANLWEEELGEDFWNIYANEFGYTYPSLRNV